MNEITADEHKLAPGDIELRTRRTKPGKDWHPYLARVELPIENPGDLQAFCINDTWFVPAIHPLDKILQKDWESRETTALGTEF